MFLRIKITCTCCSEYVVDENISTAKILCPNCGVEYPYSEKLTSILKSAKEIPDGNSFNNEICTRVISFSEYMNPSQ